MTKQKLLKIMIGFVGIIILCFIFYEMFLVIKREKAMSAVRNNILKIEMQIENNKQERNNCATNMQLRQTENDKNREMIARLKKEYNEMVFGKSEDFIPAGQPK